MRLAHHLAHLFLPRSSNNHKPRILHNSGLLYLKLFLITFQVGIFFVARAPGPKILGFAANIAPSEVIRLINEKRVQSGLGALSENSALSSAALAKAADMINRDYWAHVAPDGTQPWKFFSDAGYKYRFAGENLARDFSNPNSAVEAWMASPTHRDNILSDKYKETGVAVMDGNLSGVETTIVVQLFGATGGSIVAPVAANTTVLPTPLPTFKPVTVVVQATATPLPLPTERPLAFVEPSSTLQGVPASKVLISPFTTTKGVSLATIALLILVMIVDFVITSKRKIARIGGRTFAHISFLGMLLVIVVILRAGNIL